MKTTLINLWKGNIAPLENLNMDEAYKSRLHLLIEDEEKLLALLDENGKELLEHFGNTHYDLHARDAEAAFVEGFRLGVRILLEALEST